METDSPDATSRKVVIASCYLDNEARTRTTKQGTSGEGRSRMAETMGQVTP